MDELELAQELADISDEISMRYFQRDPQSSRKPDGTLVTVADREIEKALRKRISEAFPSHSVLGEEGGMEGDQHSPTWILDPIDGTNNFAAGIPIFACLIALRIRGQNAIGIASAPALQERYEAARGNGARMNGASIEVSAVSRLEAATVCSGGLRWFREAGVEHLWERVVRRARRDRGFGDFWGHTLVARGAVEAMAEPELAIWDMAALEVIVEEAGGKMTTFDGNRFPDTLADDPNRRASCLSSNGRVHQELVTLLSG